MLNSKMQFKSRHLSIILDLLLPLYVLATTEIPLKNLKSEIKTEYSHIDVKRMLRELVENNHDCYRHINNFIDDPNELLNLNFMCVFMIEFCKPEYDDTTKEKAKIIFDSIFEQKLIMQPSLYSIQMFIEFNTDDIVSNEHVQNFLIESISKLETEDFIKSINFAFDYNRVREAIKELLLKEEQSLHEFNIKLIKILMRISDSGNLQYEMLSEYRTTEESSIAFINLAIEMDLIVPLIEYLKYIKTLPDFIDIKHAVEKILDAKGKYKLSYYLLKNARENFCISFLSDKCFLESTIDIIVDLIKSDAVLPLGFEQSLSILGEDLAYVRAIEYNLEAVSRTLQIETLTLVRSLSTAKAFERYFSVESFEKFIIQILELPNSFKHLHLISYSLSKSKTSFNLILIKILIKETNENEKFWQEIKNCKSKEQKMRYFIKTASINQIDEILDNHNSKNAAKWSAEICETINDITVDLIFEEYLNSQVKANSLK